MGLRRTIAAVAWLHEWAPLGRRPRPAQQPVTRLSQGVAHPEPSSRSLRCAMQVVDAFRASYGVENALYAVTQLAQVHERPPPSNCWAGCAEALLALRS